MTFLLFFTLTSMPSNTLLRTPLTPSLPLTASYPSPSTLSSRPPLTIPVTPTHYHDHQDQTQPHSCLSSPPPQMPQFAPPTSPPNTAWRSMKTRESPATCWPTLPWCISAGLSTTRRRLSTFPKTGELRKNAGRGDGEEGRK